MRWWTLFFYITYFTVFVFSGLIAHNLFQHREKGEQKAKLVLAFALVFLAMFLSICCEIVAAGFGFEQAPKYTRGFGIFYWLGKSIMTTALVGFWFYFRHISK